MSNIDDYFGGNKKRKVEPIDEDVEVTDNGDEQTADPPKGKAGNWDFLANMFGIAGAKKKEKQPSVPSEDEEETFRPEDSIDVEGDDFVDEELDQDVVEEEKTPAAIVEDPLKALEEIADAPAEDKADLLTQIFSAGFGSASEDDSSAESVTEEESVTEAPKSERSSKSRRKRRDGRSRRKSKRDEIETPDIETEADAESLDPIEDENFVEFEIEELDHTPVDDEEESRRGRSRRRRGGRKTKSSREEVDNKPRKRRSRVEPVDDLADEFSDDLDSADIDPRDIDPRNADGDEEETTTRRRSRNRNRKRGSRSAKESVGEEQRTSRRSRSGRDRDNDNLRDDEHDRDRDRPSSESHDDDSRRRPRRSRRGRDRDREGRDSGASTTRRERVPTWKDAISEMIESNTKAHSSRGGRGGRGGRSGGSGGGDRSRGRGRGGKGRGRS